MMRALKAMFVLLLGINLTCCGGGGGGGEPSAPDTNNKPAKLNPPSLPSAVLTEQKQVPKQWFEGCKDGRRGCEDTEPLQQLITTHGSQGYNEYVTAGVTEDDDGMVMRWAVYKNPADESERIFGHLCQGPTDCISARILLSDGVSYFLDLNGESLARRTVGRPVLSKILPGKDHDDFTTLNLPLTEEEEENASS